MQIEKIILYSKIGQKRIVDFKLGKVNIISGESKSGKTALIGIIDYCLASNSCDISEGKIKDTVFFFAIVLKFNDGERVFIARQNPNVKQVASISTVCLIRNIGVDTPEFEDIESNFNIESLKDFLSSKLGINENMHVPDSLTREPLKANFKHSRFYCYQPQYLIADPNQLFYNQNKEFVPQSIKDTLPYFLGAINEESLSIESEIAYLKKELNKLQREKRESEKIKSEGSSQAFSLIEEAKEIGLINSEAQVNTEVLAYELLVEISNWEYKPLAIKSENRISKQLIESRNDLRLELNKIEDNLKAVKDFAKTTLGYNNEVRQQEIRLSSINILNIPENSNNNICPLCDSKLKTPIPSIKQINNSLTQIREDLKSTKVESPRIQSYIATLKEQEEKIQTDLKRVEKSISSIYEENEKARTLRDLNIRRGKILGRISLFLESIKMEKESNESEVRMTNLKKIISTLESQIDTESEKERLLSIINKINLQMSKWVAKLDVEYDDSPIRFDLNKLTIYVDTDTKPIALPQIGSGANWVAYHLLILFALQKHFIQNQRPVPSFLILDQPTQVYYPPEKSDEIISSDDIAVDKMFNFMFDVVETLSPSMQVIVMDHAYLKNQRFEDSVIQEWRKGNKLVPEEWESIH
ncbi:MAG: DUF3732 domain-containing protein [Bacteroidota bacterium]|nr:DUF3732 domain-containing protein [Bacteroidota bacterium]